MCQKENIIMETFRSNTRLGPAEVNANNAWNKQYPQLKANMYVIDRALKVIQENTKPLQYKTSKNIVNASF